MILNMRPVKRARVRYSGVQASSSCNGGHTKTGKQDVGPNSSNAHVPGQCQPSPASNSTGRTYCLVSYITEKDTCTRANRYKRMKLKYIRTSAMRVLRRQMTAFLYVFNDAVSGKHHLMSVE